MKRFYENFDAAYRDTYGPLVSYASSHLTERYLAPDVVQSCFVDLLRAKKSRISTRILYFSVLKSCHRANVGFVNEDTARAKAYLAADREIKDLTNE